MAEQEIPGILRKIDLEGLLKSFYEEDLAPDIVCNLATEDFEKLGLKGRNLIVNF